VGAVVGHDFGEGAAEAVGGPGDEGDVPGYIEQLIDFHRALLCLPRR
jgi:hypothetical protein